MKFFRISTAVLAVFLTIGLANCSSAQKSGDTQSTDSKPKDKEKTNSRSFVMDQANQALSDLTYSPYGKGWTYKTTDLPPADFKTWVGQFKTQIQQAVDSVGDGFLLQVTGHTCSIGPREAEGNKKGNIFYSTQRAKGVYNALLQNGIPAKRMTFVGVANDELLGTVGPKDQLNRRVTFKIVEDPNAAAAPAGGTPAPTP